MTTEGLAQGEIDFIHEKFTQCKNILTGSRVVHVCSILSMLMADVGVQCDVPEDKMIEAFTESIRFCYAKVEKDGPTTQ